MGIRNRMTESVPTRMNEQDKIALNERAARADRLVEKWARIPEIGSGLKAMDEKRAHNLAILLENQAKHMSRLTETQFSGSYGATPENMIRLVRLAYPNSIRDKIFTDFAMETAKDSVKYLEPVYSTQAGNRDNAGPGGVPVAMPGQTVPTYESAFAEHPQEVGWGAVTGAGPYVFTFASDEFGASGVNLVDGYTVLFDNTGNVIAVQQKIGTWLFAASAGTGPTVTGPVAGAYTYTAGSGATAVLTAGTAKGQARYNSELDTAGTYLGSVELIMKDYQFKPRPVTLGVSWTELAALTLDTTVGVSTEETLMDAAAQEIKKSLDFRAVKLAYQVAKANGSTLTTFDAEAGAGTDDSYVHTAQTVSQSIEKIGDDMLNTILRGGVSRIVGGPKAITYLRLNAGFTTKGAQPRIGGHQVGEIYGIPVFKVPSSVIPEDELLCVWKNENNEADVFLAFGTLVPFYATPIWTNPANFTHSAGLAYFGDSVILQKRYAALIKITNIR